MLRNILMIGIGFVASCKPVQGRVGAQTESISTTGEGKRLYIYVNDLQFPLNFDLQCA